jgi:oligosaccharide repeat unit polymerase
MLILVSLSGFVLPYFFDRLFGLAKNSRPSLAAIAFLNLLLAIVPLFLWKRTNNLLSLRNLLGIFFALVFGFWPMYVIIFGQPSISSLTSVGNPYAHLYRSLQYSALGIFAYQVSYILPFGAVIAKKIQLSKGNWNHRRVNLALILTIAMLLVSLFAIWEIAGGTTNILNAPTRVRKYISGEFYFTLGLTFTPVVLQLAFAHAVLHKKRMNLIWILAFIYTVAYFVLGSRSNVVIIWLSFLLIYILITQERLKIRQYILGVVFTIFAVVSVIGIRDIRTSEQSFADIDINDLAIRNLSSSGDIIDKIFIEVNQVEIFALVTNLFPDSMPFLYGKTYLDLVYQPIPRSIWPNKPLPSGFLLGQLFFGIDVGAPPTIIGDLYMNFGGVGVFLGMILYGIVWSAIDESFLRYKHNPVMVSMYVFFLSNAYRIVTRGFLPVAMSVLLFVIPALVLARYFTDDQHGRFKAGQQEGSSPRSFPRLMGTADQ